MGTVAHVFSFLIIFSLSSLPNSHSHFLPVRSLFLSQKTQTHILSSSILSPSLTSLSLSFIACHQRGKIGAVARSTRGMWHGLDGGGVGLSWWLMAVTWGGLDGGLIWVYGVGRSWFVWVCLVWVDLGCGLIWVWFDRVDLGMWVWVDRVDGWWLLMVMVAVGLGWSGWSG